MKHIILLGFTVGLVACGGGSTTESGAAGDASAGSPAIITVDGSSTVYPVTEAVAEEFQRARPGTRITVGISGTGGGVAKFCRDEIDIADASRPIRPIEAEACVKAGVQFIELPVAYDGLAIVVHPKNTWATSMTVAELKKLWEPSAQGKILRWSDVRSGWPNNEVHLFGAGTDSGTFDYFTEAIVGKEDASRGDYTSSEDDNVIVQGVSGDEHALGYFGYAYYEENKDKLKLVAIDDGNDANGKGPILPSPESVNNGTYRPLSRPIFIYPKIKALERPEVASLRRLLSEGRGASRPRGRIYSAHRTRVRDGAQPVYRQEGRVDVRRHGRSEPGDARTADVRNSFMQLRRRALVEFVIERILFCLRGRVDSGDGGDRPGADVRDGGLPARGAGYRVPVRHRLDAALFRQTLRRAAARRRHAADIRDRDGRRAAGRPSRRDLPQRVRHRPGAACRQAGAGGPGRRAYRGVWILRAAVRHAPSSGHRARPRRLQRARLPASSWAS